MVSSDFLKICYWKGGQFVEKNSIWGTLPPPPCDTLSYMPGFFTVNYAKAQIALSCPCQKFVDLIRLPLLKSLIYGVYQSCKACMLCIIYLIWFALFISTRHVLASFQNIQFWCDVKCLSNSKWSIWSYMFLHHQQHVHVSISFH